MPAAELRATIRLTVRQLCETLWGSTAGVNGGCYPGTTFKRRDVDLDHVLTVEDRGVVLLRDGEDGWIAERICGGRFTTIGRSDWRKLIAAGFEVVS